MEEIHVVGNFFHHVSVIDKWGGNFDKRRERKHFNGSSKRVYTCEPTDNWIERTIRR